MNRLSSITCGFLSIFLVGCVSAQDIAQSGDLRNGMTKDEVVIAFTFASESPFVPGSTSEFFSKLGIEIVGTPSRDAFFVFSGVQRPHRPGNLFTQGDGYLESWFSTYEDAKAFVDKRVGVAESPELSGRPLPEETTEKLKRMIEVSSGSGFAITKDGHIATNNHVVSDCDALEIYQSGRTVSASKTTIDATNDLAILKAEPLASDVLPIRDGSPKLLEETFVGGFPFGGEISASIKITRGVVSALLGAGNNASLFQIDASIQPGNSGGPVVDDKGNVIGVAVASLDQLEILGRFGALPQNSNFAVKSNVLTNLMLSSGLEPKAVADKKLDYDELGSLISAATVYVSCQKWQ
jgi:S1-C subfamily serine protease